MPAVRACDQVAIVSLLSSSRHVTTSRSKPLALSESEYLEWLGPPAEHALAVQQGPLDLPLKAMSGMHTTSALRSLCLLKVW
eukprot:4593961-Amphidinium_carterae.1